MEHVPTSEGVNVFHHAGGAVKDGKVITKELLSPTTNLMNVSTVLKDFTHS
jgi:hypothetical protein